MANGKRCMTCRKRKPVADFHRDSSRRDGLAPACSECRTKINRDYNQNLRRLVIEHYGGECACCSEKHLAFLAIDHVNGGGNAHRRKIGTGMAFYRWLIREGFPDEFRVLCHNCNVAIGHWGVCPHAVEGGQ